MKLTTSLVAAAFAFAVLAPSEAALHKRHQVLWEGADFMEAVAEAQKANPNAFPVYWFDQKVDHFSKHSPKFKQRYFLNDTYYKPGGPVLLYAPGEATARPVGGGQLRELAKATNGLMVSLEHRYYGESLPTKKSDFHGMRFLTVDNALADMAYFIKHSKLPKVSKKTKWAVVGGSYPGVQAAWMRQSYPDLVHAALASSAPVQAKEDFYEYDQAMSDALPCSGDLHKVSRYVDRILESGNRGKINKIKKMFHLQNITSDADFAFAYTDILAGLVQYYWPAKEDPIEQFCNSVKAAKTIEDKIKVWGDYIKDKHDSDPDLLHFYDYDGMRKDLKHDNTKSWYWQTCLELGYFQTAPRGKSIRSRFCDLKQQRGACKKIFGKSMRPDIAKVNRKHHGWNIKTSRIHFTDGELDPWKRLSVNSDKAPTRKPTNNNPLSVIERGSHCTDLYNPTASDSKSLKDARKSEIEAFKRWLL
ncbi:uncharacterized protein VTP21DRAFT_2560 [Calcarisporiella thermophila]|uniref:uncharacterized protein n=1 Tax=Calcarisporiella thermophila TaxID=911321 RepID=UPI003743BBB8